jgi:hypothetical protein
MLLVVEKTHCLPGPASAGDKTEISSPQIPDGKHCVQWAFIPEPIRCQGIVENTKPGFFPAVINNRYKKTGEKQWK